MCEESWLTQSLIHCPCSQGTHVCHVLYFLVVVYWVQVSFLLFLLDLLSLVCYTHVFSCIYMTVYMCMRLDECFRKLVHTSWYGMWKREQMLHIFSCIQGDHAFKTEPCWLQWLSEGKHYQPAVRTRLSYTAY